jgi:hypothetical protein
MGRESGVWPGFRGILVPRHVENFMVGRRIRRSATSGAERSGKAQNAFAELSEVGPTFEKASVDNVLSGRRDNEKNTVRPRRGGIGVQSLEWRDLKAAQRRVRDLLMIGRL